MVDVVKIEQLKDQYAMFCKQRDQAHMNLQQLIGAIYACEALIKQAEGADENGEVRLEDAGQVA